MGAMPGRGKEEWVSEQVFKLKVKAFLQGQNSVLSPNARSGSFWRYAVVPVTQ